MTVQCAVIGCKLKQNANEGCNSCASLAGLVLSFIASPDLLYRRTISSRSGTGRQRRDTVVAEAAADTARCGLRRTPPGDQK